MTAYSRNETPNRPGLLTKLTLSIMAFPVFATAADMHQPPTTWPGGLDPRAMLLSISKGETSATVTWTAPRGPFQVEMKPSLDSGTWQPVGAPTMNESAEIPLGDGNGFIRVAAGNGNYVGQEAVWNCGICHPDAHRGWVETSHAKAFETLRAIGMHKNPQCLPCHTVGYGLPNGFKDEATTPNLAGVQCENCHGPAGDHLSNPRDPSLRPSVTIASEVCGGCHNGFHHPTYDEWSKAGHAHVTEPGMFNAGVGRMYQCGVCHSGAVRNAVIKDYDAGGDGTNVQPPSIKDANSFAQECTVCHDPHRKFDTLTDLGLPAQPAQLRNPVSSVKFMSYVTSTNATGFAQQYDPTIQICGQCHNERGATWANTTARPPHHSPQYNILIGQAVDPRFDTNTLNGQPISLNMGPAGHGDPTVPAPAGNPGQCTACHNRPEHPDNLSPSNPAYTGHQFTLETLACAECHGFLGLPDAEEIAEGGIQFIQAGIRQGIANVMAELNAWATNKIQDLYTPGTTNYVAFFGNNAPESVVPWEFTNIGQLNPGRRGPPAAAQARISRYAPEILKSRFLLYLVEHDASYGVHNPPYARYLLQQAREFARQAPGIPAE
ncbi:MAG: hypothetical protein IPM17_12755 [Verrucomicrobia bacterium]|nr:hypothetical protein [Verrucomicrobiota bacterium]